MLGVIVVCCSLVYVDNFGDVLLCCVIDLWVVGECFYVVDDDVLLVVELLWMVGDVLG